MARYRVTFDIVSDDPSVSIRQLHAVAKAAQEYTQVVILPNHKVTFDKAADPHVTVHKHESSARRGCQLCVDALVNDQLS